MATALLEEAPGAERTAGRGGSNGNGVGADVGGRRSPALSRTGSQGRVAALVDVLAAAAMAGVAGAAMTSAFQLDDLVRPVGVAAVAAVGASFVLSTVFRAPLVVSSLLAAALLVPAAVLGCGGGPGDVASGLRSGARTILESLVPMRPDPEVLVVPFVSTALAAFLGAEIAQRARLSVGPVVPSLLVLGVGLAFGIDGRLPPAWIPVAWVVLAAASVGWRTVRGVAARFSGGPTGDAGSFSGRRRPLVASLAAIVVVAVPATVVARTFGPDLPGLEDRDRFSLRDLVEQPVESQELANPLSEMTGLQDGPDFPLFSADTSGRVERWRLAVLDVYEDVGEWRTTGGFLPAGGELQPPSVGRGAGGAASSGDDEAVGSSGVTQRIETSGLEGRWLPVADRAVEVSLDAVLFDPATGVLLSEDDALPSSYDVTSEIPEPSAVRLAGATVATDDEARAALELPDELPEELTAAAEEATAGTAPGYPRAVALERYLTEPGAVQPFELELTELSSGHSPAILRCFLLVEGDCARGRRGSTEQFVALFAVMARQVGLPTRAVVGFEGSGVAGPDEIGSHDATAWVEVKFEDIGWVAFNPVPNVEAEVTEGTTPPPPATGAGEDQATPPPTPVDENEEAAQVDADDSEATDDGGGPVPLWLAAGVVIVALVVLFPGLRRRRRRARRRRASDAAARVVGAWLTAVDELVVSGVTVGADRAVADIVGESRATVSTAGVEPLVPLGALANRARFAPSSPDDSAATEAWTLSDRFVAERRKGRPLPRRLRDYFHLRN